MAAKHCEGSLLDSPRYEALDGLSRCIHFSDLQRCYKKRMLISHKLSSKVVDTEGVGKILWFGPSKDSSEHNWYGNVNFTISMKDLVQKFGYNIYYIDTLEYKTHTASRLLLAKYDYDHKFEEVNFSDNGSPLKRHRWRHVATCDSEYSPVHPHEVEVGIEVDKDDCKWLYNECIVESNDHSCANRRKNGKYKKHICHRFNTFGLQCPYGYSEDTAHDVLCTKYPDFFGSETEEESDEESLYDSD